ncbi:hypothetical protein ACFPIB_12615 [Adhaeribacter terreus]|uniref:Uncharacterized protein n=1 Tax=Adhaeribacter terreus TaxID=529703 RepID=A0ABW0EEY3_9BACT
MFLGLKSQNAMLSGVKSNSPFSTKYQGNNLLKTVGNQALKVLIQSVKLKQKSL